MALTIDDFKPGDTVRIVNESSRFFDKFARVADVTKGDNPKVYVTGVDGDIFGSGWIYKPEDLQPVLVIDGDAENAAAAQSDAINHPSHYGGDTVYETIKVLAAWLSADQLEGFCLGNAIKYLSRAGKKSDAKLQDWRKAKWYLEYLIAEEDRRIAVEDIFRK